MKDLPIFSGEGPEEDAVGGVGVALGEGSDDMVMIIRRVWDTVTDEKAN